MSSGEYACISHCAEIQACNFIRHEFSAYNAAIHCLSDIEDPWSRHDQRHALLSRQCPQMIGMAWVSGVGSHCYHRTVSRGGFMVPLETPLLREFVVIRGPKTQLKISIQCLLFMRSDLCKITLLLQRGRLLAEGADFEAQVADD